jgi:large subunit ribosomal protein L24
MASVKKGDQVVVLSGKDRGRTGRILRVIPKKDRVVVEGVNIIKRHTRPTQRNPKGGILEKEAPIHISNVKLQA